MSDRAATTDSEDEAFSAFVTEYQEALAAGRLPPSPERLSPAGRARWERMRPALLLLARAGGVPEALPAPPVTDDPSTIRSPAPARHPPPSSGKMPRQLGRFALIRELGRGGMGIVYLARDPALQRLVALKTITRTGLDDKDQLKRFEAEAQLHAQQHHPNIVQVYETGWADRRPFLVMEYVDGVSLSQHLDGRPMEARRAAALLAQVAGAIAHAHQAGIIHRDLKPSNILLDAAGTPRVTDFGLARSLCGSFDLTRTGELIGTPVYMAPEIVTGSKAGPLVDVYGLGAILYELLTGHAPFVGVDVFFILAQVQHAEPVPPRQLYAQVPADLETICLKCLHKEPRKRYAGAAELADDLQRFLDGRPIRARPAGRIERALKWCRRNPAGVAVLATVAAAVVVIAAIVVRYTGELEHERDDARRQEQAATQARAETEGQLIDASTALGLTAEVRNDLPVAALWFAVAARQAENDGERRQLNRLRWQTYSAADPVPWRAFRLPAGNNPQALVLHPEGRWLISAHNSGWLLWDFDHEQAATWPGPKTTITAAAWTPDGHRLAVGAADGTVRVCAFPRGDTEATWKLDAPVACLSFSRDGQYLAAAGGPRVLLVSLNALATAPRELRLPEAVGAVVFSPSARRIATVCGNHTAAVLDLDPAAPGEPILGPVPHLADLKTAGRESLPGFFGEDELVTTAGPAVVIWDIPGKKIKERIPAGTFPVMPLTVSPDGTSFVIRHDFRSPELWLGTPHKGVELATDRVPCQTAAYSADGRQVLLALWTGFQVWNADATPAGSLIRTQMPNFLGACSADGRWLATTSGNDLVRLWRRGRPSPLRAILPKLGHPLGDPVFVLSPDGERILAGDTNNDRTELRVHSLDDGKPVGAKIPLFGRPLAGAFSPDGRTVFMLTLNGERSELHAWDSETGRPRFASVSLPFVSQNMACSPVGPGVIIVGGGGAVELRDAATGALRFTRQHPGTLLPAPPARCLQPAPDGRSFVTFGFNGDVQQWSAVDGTPMRVLHPSTGDPCDAAGFSPDSRYLLTSGSMQSQVRTWDLTTGAEAGPPLVHGEKVITARFVPGGAALLTSTFAGVVRVWDWRTGRLLAPAMVHPAAVEDAVTSADGRWIAAVQSDGVVRLWDARTGRQLAPAWPVLPRSPYLLLGSPRVAFSGDGKRLIVAVSGRQSFLLDLTPFLTPPTLSADDLVLLAEINAGATAHPGGNVEHITSEQWLARWRQFRQRQPNYHNEWRQGD